MLNLTLKRTENSLHITLDDVQHTAPWESFTLNDSRIKTFIEDTRASGKMWFETLFSDQMRQTVSNAKPGTRLLINADQPEVQQIPWEYLYDSASDSFVATRLNMLRGASKLADNGAMLQDVLEVIALPVAPVDEVRVLNTIGEYRNLIQAITAAEHEGKVSRVCPPTKSRMEQMLNPSRSTIIHFMGHSVSRDGRALLLFENDRARHMVVP